MFQDLFSPNAAMDFVQKSFAPFTQLTSLSAKSFEKLARFQVETVVDLVNHTAARVDATVKSRNPFELAARHSSLTSDFMVKRNANVQEFVKLATELQTDVKTWVQEAKTQLTTTGREAA